MRDLIFFLSFFIFSSSASTIYRAVAFESIISSGNIERLLRKPIQNSRKRKCAAITQARTGNSKRCRLSRGSSLKM